jgi:hypothetical protein
LWVIFPTLASRLLPEIPHFFTFLCHTFSATPASLFFCFALIALSNSGAQCSPPQLLTAFCVDPVPLSSSLVSASYSGQLQSVSSLHVSIASGGCGNHRSSSNCGRCCAVSCASAAARQR